MTCNCPATTAVGGSTDTSIPFLNMGGGGKGRKKKNRKSKTKKKKAKQTKRKKHMRKSRKHENHAKILTKCNFRKAKSVALVWWKDLF